MLYHVQRAFALYYVMLAPTASPDQEEKWEGEVLLGMRRLGTTFYRGLLRTTFWCGLSNHQAAAAQMGT